MWLAGAGPGDGALLTLKTARLMEQADVIVYDALISAEILSRIPETKEVIYVGSMRETTRSPRRRSTGFLSGRQKRETCPPVKRGRSLCVRKRRRGTGKPPSGKDPI